METPNKTQDEQKENDETNQPIEPTDQPTPPTEDETQVLVEREPDELIDEEAMMDHTIEMADKLAKYEVALNMILNFIIKRCYVGDFVSHDSVNKPLEERTANINNAAAERIARDLGIRESNRSELKKETGKDGHYRYSCTGDFTFRGQKISAEGQATTRNPFHKKKAPAEIREDYIRTECSRDLVKQGVRKIFGLRKIPLTKLQELGYDISKVKMVSFEAKEGSQAAKNPNATKSPPSVKWMFFVSSEDKTWGKKAYTIFKTENGNEISCWHTGEILAKLKATVGKDVQVRIEMRQQGKYWNVEKILEESTV